MKILETEEGLRARAAELFPEREQQQEKWIASVLWMREKSKTGFALDQYTTKIVERSVLKDYRAPIVPITTVVSLPDEQVIPGTDQVVDIKRKRK